MTVAVILVFFRGPLASGLQLAHGDSYNGLIEISILEHWFAVFTRGDTWNVTGYFYPYPDTLGYNDTDLVPGIFYIVARFLRADPFASVLFAHAAMKAIGYAGMYLLLRTIAAVRWWLAIAGAAVFAISNASLLNMHHGQLLSVGLLPWLTIAVVRTGRAIAAGNSAEVLRWGALLAVGYGITAFSAFYAAWFFAFFVFVALVVILLLMKSGDRSTVIVGMWKVSGSLLAVGLLALAALLPLIAVYAPKLAAGARHDWADGAARTLVSLSGLINVGTGNLVWGHLFDLMTHFVNGRAPSLGETRFGNPLGLWLVFVAAAVRLARRREEHVLEASVCLSVLLAIVLMFRLPGGYSLWYFVWKIVPGAGTIRVVARALLFAEVPIIWLTFSFLDRTALPASVLALISAFLLLEQKQTAAPLALHRAREMEMLGTVGPPPPACRSFAVISARGPSVNLPAEATVIAREWNYEGAGELLGKYRHNVDAMLLAAYYGTPTINGFSTFNPPDADFGSPDQPDYMNHLRSYASRHRLRSVCGLDMRSETGKWRMLTMP